MILTQRQALGLLESSFMYLHHHPTPTDYKHIILLKTYLCTDIKGFKPIYVHYLTPTNRNKEAVSISIFRAIERLMNEGKLERISYARYICTIKGRIEAEQALNTLLTNYREVLSTL